VFIQFCWWSYLLVNLNDEVYNNKVLIMSYQYSNSIHFNTQKELMTKKLHHKWWMIAGEGAVFISLLGFGVYQTLKAFKKEVALNHQQRNFLLSVTHEFKSPLASIKLYMQTLQKRDLERPKQLLFIANAITDVERLNTLVENALTATQIENSSYMLQKQDVNISQLGESIIQMHHDKAKFTNNIQPDIFVNGDELALTSLLLNILENGIKYSPQGNTVHLHISANNSKAIIAISDNGYGIEDKEKEKVFDKFYRIGSEDTRRTKGTGLGLFIVKHIINSHGGKITVKNNQPQGSIFEIVLPLA
jgi:two-component system phosphate regulon sensor histidine kinase PhoR